jgi:VWFA-related protein
MRLRSSGTARTGMLGYIPAILFLFASAAMCHAQTEDSTAWPRISRQLAWPAKTPPPRPGEVHVLEDGVEQLGVSVSHPAGPVSLCLVIDASNSMKPVAATLIAAARRMAAAKQAGDEVEVISFQGPTHVDLGFTRDAAKVDAALRGVSFGDGSGVYDAISVALGTLKTHAAGSTPVVVLFSDGDDNYSHMLLPDLMRGLTQPDSPVLYAVQPPAFGKIVRNPLQTFTAPTGGMVVTPEASRMADAMDGLSRDIHTRYLLQYVSTNTQRDGKLHKIEVRYQAAGASKAKTLVRQEYYAPSQ